MSNFLDYLNGGEDGEKKESLEDTSTKEILNRILAEMISIREVVEDLEEAVTELKSVRETSNTNAQPLQTEFDRSGSTQAQETNNFVESRKLPLNAVLKEHQVLEVADALLD